MSRGGYSNELPLDEYPGKKGSALYFIEALPSLFRLTQLVLTQLPRTAA